MIFFDFEVFKYDWLLVTFNGKEFTRIENDRNKLLEYYEQHKSYESYYIRYQPKASK